eukprot:CAMPEP_0168234856 /NCGR_PEP_ID=MMETSP0140_2-20121125/18501_1 /TAXON_ID=44445 /ORGANISM="Pseudo-nitzschia australis, Strain 10249 10 AB" /LENGTH=481 /DNA_ID=CAMNT_0008167701 /DNA_START=260 /DNA_END=1701 /DNA_ORIENTATION=+
MTTMTTTTTIIPMAMAMIVRPCPCYGAARRSLSFVARASSGRFAKANNIRHCDHEQHEICRRRILRVHQTQQTILRASSRSTEMAYANDSHTVKNDNETLMQQQQGRQEEIQVALEEFRKEQAKSLGKFPSQILCNSVISEICSAEPVPTTKEDLLRVKGLGARKLDHFGDGILSIVSVYNSNSNSNNNGVAGDPESKNIDEISYNKDLHLFSSDSHVIPAAPSSSVDNNETTVQQQEQENLYIALEKYRKEQAKSLGKFPSQILPNMVLDRISSAEPLPTTKEELFQIKGFGSKKLNDFGDGILSVLSTFKNNNNICKNDSIVPMTMDIIKGDPYKNVSLFSLEAGAPYYHIAPAPYSAPLDECASFAPAESHLADTNTVTPEAKSLEEDFDTGNANGATTSFSLDSFVAPAPYSAPLDEYVAPAPAYSVPVENNDSGLDTISLEEDFDRGNANDATSSFSLDSFVAPAPYSAPLDEYVA